MFKLIVLMYLTTCAYGHRILGGTNASIVNYPYQISLELHENHSCGGSILSPTKILTAAHCTISFQLSTLRVRAGSSWREQGGQVVNLARKTEHPQYNTVNINNDVAVVIPEQTLTFNIFVKPIKISDIVDVLPGTYATVTGWGVTETGERAKRLQMLQLPRVSDETCTKLFPSNYNKSTQICYGGVQGKSTCSSDSGGPLVLDGEQIGVVSYGPANCKTYSPEVYAKLDSFRNFVNSVN